MTRLSRLGEFTFICAGLIVSCLIFYASGQWIWANVIAPFLK